MEQKISINQERCFVSFKAAVNKMKRIRICALFCALMVGLQMTSVTAAGVSADTEEETPVCISPAIRVLAAQTTMKKNSVVGKELCFSKEDFSAVLGYSPTEVTLTSLPDPTKGVLKLGGMTLAPGSRLSATVLHGLRFVPTGGGDAEAVSASFTFTATGSAYETAVPLSCMLYLLSTPNASPTASERHLTTYTDIPVFASLNASDPEFDDLTYEIVRPPKKGSVSLDAENGSFVYTPTAGARGSDVFSWRAVDAWGNQSDVVRTSLSVRHADDDLYYTDLEEHWCAAAAMRLTEDGIFGGTALGEHTFFEPDTAVTRGEFLVCAMRAAGYDDLDRAALPMFANADEIPDYLSGYLAAAYEDGIINGSVDAAGAAVFYPNETITRAEAAVILYRLFDIDTPAVLPVFSAEDEAVIPAWSVGAFSSVCAVGIMSASDPAGIVDRAQCAQMLSSAMDAVK